MSEVTVTKAINSALHDAMAKNNKVLCFGLGVTDPKNILEQPKGLLRDLEMIVYLTYRFPKML